MSSYLNIYMQPKNSNKLLLIADYSSCSEIYTMFREYLNVPWTSTDEYRQLSSKDLEPVIEAIQAQIKKIDSRISEYEKHAGKNPDYIEEILENRELVEELTYQLHFCIYLRQVIKGAEDKDYIELSRVFVNIT